MFCQPHKQSRIAFSPREMSIAPPPHSDNTCQLWEYAVSVDLADRFQQTLFAEEVATQWTSLANPEKVFVLLQVQLGKGGCSNTAVWTRNWWARRSFLDARTSSTSSPQEFHTSNTNG